jgi:hypothetical protein
MGQKLARLDDANEAAGRGDLDLLTSTYEKLGLLPNVDGANAAAINGRLDVIQWLAQRRPPILPDDYGRRAASMANQHHVIDWLNSRPGILCPVAIPTYQ